MDPNKIGDEGASSKEDASSVSDEADNEIRDADDWDLAEVVSAPHRKPTEEPYNPSRDREHVRGKLALRLLHVFCGQLVLYIIMAVVAVYSGKFNVQDVKEIISVTLPPTVALVGAATGFYFGAHSTGDQPGRSPKTGT